MRTQAIEFRDLVKLLGASQESLVDEHAERDYLVRLMSESHGHVTDAAHRMGIERQSLHRILKRIGVEPRAFREPRSGHRSRRPARHQAATLRE